MNDLAEHILLFGDQNSPAIDYLLGEVGTGEIYEAMESVSRGRMFDLRARVVRTRVNRMLRENYAALLTSIDIIGYTSLSIRYALTHHWSRLAKAELNSLGNCIYLDLQQATSNLCYSDRVVVWMMQAGFRPKEIGPVVDKLGSRAVSVVVRKLKEQLT